MMAVLKWYGGIFLSNQFMVVYDGGVEMVWWYIPFQPVHGGGMMVVELKDKQNSGFHRLAAHCVPTPH